MCSVKLETESLTNIPVSPTVDLRDYLHKYVLLAQMARYIINNKINKQSAMFLEWIERDVVSSRESTTG